MKKRNQLGEVATVITLSTLIIVGLVSLVSNAILKKPQTTSTKAASCDPAWYCAGECAPDDVRASFEAINGPANAASAWRSEKAQNCGLSESECSAATTCAPLGKPTYPQTPGVGCDASEWSCGGECASQAVRNMFGDPSKWRQEKAKNCGFPVGECSTRTDCTTTSGAVPTGTTTDRCQCVNGKANDAKLCGDTNPCGAAIAGPCDYGAWRTDCTGSGESCPSDAGVGYTYWCDGTNWRFQYPNCVVQCKPAYLTQAPSTKDPRCVGKNSGDPPNNPKTLEPVCDGSYMVTMSEYCDQFGQVQSGPGRRVDPLKSCLDKPEDQKTVCENSNGVKKNTVFRSCVKQVCDQSVGYYTCVDQYWDNNCNIQERTGVKTATTCSRTGVVPTITGRPNINWGNPPTPTIKASVILNRPSGAPTPTGGALAPDPVCSPLSGNSTACLATGKCDYFISRPFPGGITVACNKCVPKNTPIERACPDIPTAVTPALNVCPDDGVNFKCVVKIPFLSGCPVGYDATDRLACAGPVLGSAKVCCVKRDVAPTIVPTRAPLVTKRIEIDEGTSTRYWMTNMNVCDYVGRLNPLPVGPNIANLRNCRAPNYVTDALGRKYIEVTFSPSQKTALCSFGGNGYCTFIN